jgi:spermidine/putrescine transport system ATP-binding protein
MSETIIELRSVSRRFDGLWALRDVDLSVRRGEFLTLLGPSGCGKTTLLRLLAGFDKPTVGEVYIDGADMAALSPEQRPVNMVFQSYALFPHMTVFDNVAFGPRIKKWDRGRELSASQFFNEGDEQLVFTHGERIFIDWITGWEVILPHER